MRSDKDVKTDNISNVKAVTAFFHLEGSVCKKTQQKTKVRCGTSFYYFDPSVWKEHTVSVKSKKWIILLST